MSRSGAAYATPGQVFSSGWTVGRYYTPPMVGPVVNQSAGTGNLYVRSLWVPGRKTVDRIGAKVLTAGGAGSVVRLGIFNDGGNGFPTTLLLDAGTIDGTSNTAQEIVISQTVGPGLIWLALCAQGAPAPNPVLAFTTSHAGFDAAGEATLSNVFVPGTGMFQSGVIGAFAGSFAVSGDGAITPMITVRSA